MSFTDQVRLGYLDVGIAKKIAKPAKKFKNLSVKLAEIGHENIWSVKVGVYLFQRLGYKLVQESVCIEFKSNDGLPLLSLFCD